MLHKIKMKLFLVLGLLCMTFCFAGCSIVIEDGSSDGASKSVQEDDTSTLVLLEEEEEEDSADAQDDGSMTENSDGTVTFDSGIDSDWQGYEVTTNEIDFDPNEEYLDEDGYYTTELDVATYLVQYETLPDNFITKKEAKKMGWEGGSLKEYGKNLCIGGDYFGNYEGILPVVEGRTYHECDIDTMNKNKRGAKRIIYSDDGQIYYTDDHYETFTLIYGTDQ